MQDLLFDAPGEPTYIALWLVLVPVLVVGLIALRTRVTLILIVLLTTFSPPRALDNGPASLSLIVVMTILIAWSVGRLRSTPHRAAESAHTGVRKGAIVAIVLLALAIRVPLAWHSPDISRDAAAHDVGAEALAEGDNPYVEGAPTYAYPGGSLLVHLPLVALLPHRVGSADIFGVRATMWLIDVAIILMLAYGGARSGGPRAGYFAAFAFALHPAAVRDSSLVVTGDLVMAALAAACALALGHRRDATAGALCGAALAVKPAALVFVPVVGFVAGWPMALLAVVAAFLIQAPFFLWPETGFHGLGTFVEPTPGPSRGGAVSAWAPLYALAGESSTVRRIATFAGVAAAAGLAVWSGRTARRARSVEACALAISIPLMAAFMLSGYHRGGDQDWFLPSFLLACGIVAARDAAASTFTARVLPGEGFELPGRLERGSQ